MVMSHFMAVLTKIKRSPDHALLVGLCYATLQYHFLTGSDPLLLIIMDIGCIKSFKGLEVRIICNFIFPNRQFISCVICGLFFLFDHLLLQISSKLISILCTTSDVKDLCFLSVHYCPCFIKRA